MGRGTRTAGRVIGMFLLPPAALVVFLLLWGLLTFKVGLIGGAVVLVAWLILVVANIRTALIGGKKLGHELAEEGRRLERERSTGGSRKIVSDDGNVVSYPDLVDGPDRNTL